MHRVIVVICCLIGFVLRINAADLWNPAKCEKGCRSDAQCPKNGECHFFDWPSSSSAEANSGENAKSNGESEDDGGKKSKNNDSDRCGMCRCSSGFEAKGNRCVEKEDGDKGKKKAKESKAKKSTTPKKRKGDSEESKEKTTTTPKSTSSSSTTQTSTTPTTLTTTVTTTPKTTIITTTAIPTQGPPPAIVPLDCAAYDCDFNTEPTNDTDPLRIRIQKVGTPPPGCKKMLITPRVVCKSPLADGSTNCFGSYCLQGSDSKSICLCHFDRSGTACQEQKTGKCSSANGQISSKGYSMTGKKFVNKNDPTGGSIIARHTAASESDCLKLCQWDKTCRSINYGKLNDQKICELLGIQFDKGTGQLLETWLQNSTDWTFIKL